MKNLKRIFALVAVVALIFTLGACANPFANTNANVTETTAAEETTSDNYSGVATKVAAIKGPTAMGMVNLMDSKAYDFTLTGDPTQIVSLIATKEVQIAACPLNLAANIYNKTNGQIKILGINTLGVLYFVTNGEILTDIKSLAGKTVYATGQGSTPEYIINSLLEKNGLKDTVKVEYLSEHSELAAKVAMGEAKIAVLPEPFVTVATSKNPDVKVVLSLTDEWNRVNPETKLVQGCVIARADFIKENPEAVEKFMNDYRASVEYVNRNALAASEKIVDKGILDAAVFAVDESAKDAENLKEIKAKGVITRCNIVFIDGDEMITVSKANLETYFNAAPASVGGAVPSDDIYYAAK